MTNATDGMKAKADAFHALHHTSGAFIIPNPWDRGTARILAHLGFKALATTSMGYAFSIGQRDNSALPCSPCLVIALERYAVL